MKNLIKEEECYNFKKIEIVSKICLLYCLKIYYLEF